jgi:hypothetical protein
MVNQGIQGITWEQFGVLLTVIAGWSLVIIATVRTILSRCFKQCDGRLCANEMAARDLERRLLEMKADLPLSYVRREDHIRYETVIDAKLDRLGYLIADIRENMK